MFATLILYNVLSMFQIVFNVPRMDLPLRSKKSLSDQAASTTEKGLVPAQSPETSEQKPLISKKAKRSRKWISLYTDHEPSINSQNKYDSIEKALFYSEENLKLKIRDIYHLDEDTVVSLHNDSRWTYERISFPKECLSPDRFNLSLHADTGYTASVIIEQEKK